MADIGKSFLVLCLDNRNISFFGPALFCFVPETGHFPEQKPENERFVPKNG